MLGFGYRRDIVSAQDSQLRDTVRRFLRFVGHPPKWNGVDKCLAAGMVITPLMVMSYLLHLYFVSNPSLAPYYNQDFMPAYLRMHEVTIGGWIAIGIAGLVIRRRSRDNKIYTYAASQFACISSAIFLYAPGYFTTLYLLGVLGGGMMLLLFFDQNQALWGIATLAVIYVVISAGIFAGVIPAAPLVAYVPIDGDGRLSPVYTAVNAVSGFALMTLMLGAMAVTIFQWREREAKIESMSKTDPLTGLANRRHFFNTLQNEVARSLRTGRPLSFVICDTDKFKAINDTYGHQAGDEVLKTIADVMRANLRMGLDTVGRIGGDEFAIVMTDTNLDGARTLANRIAEAVRRQLFGRNGVHYSTSLSIGVVGRHDEPVDVNMLVEVADTLLYQAKREGRDRVAAGALAEFSNRAEA